MRAFVAVEISDAVKQEIARVQRSLDGPVKVRWCTFDQLHLTLRFLGEMRDDLEPDVRRAIESIAGPVAPFDATIAGVGAFPAPRRPQVIWVGMHDAANSLATLQAGVEAAIEPLGFERERRAFTPHITIGRVKGGPPRALGDLGQAIHQVPAAPLGTTRVDAVTLFRSDLRPSGAVYTALARAPLGRAPGA